MTQDTTKVATDVAQEIFTRLDALAAKAGIAVEHFWPLFVRQQVVEWWAQFGTALAVCVLGLGVTLLAVRLDKRRRSSLDDAPEVLMVLGGAVAVIGLFCLAVTLANISEALNPEYHALMDILGTVR